MALVTIQFELVHLDRPNLSKWSQTYLLRTTFVEFHRVIPEEKKKQQEPHVTNLNPNGNFDLEFILKVTKCV